MRHTLPISLAKNSKNISSPKRGGDFSFGVLIRRILWYNKLK